MSVQGPHCLAVSSTTKSTFQLALTVLLSTSTHARHVHRKMYSSVSIMELFDAAGGHRPALCTRVRKYALPWQLAALSYKNWKPLGCNVRLLSILGATSPSYWLSGRVLASLCHRIVLTFELREQRILSPATTYAHKDCIFGLLHVFW